MRYVAMIYSSEAQDADRALQLCQNVIERAYLKNRIDEIENQLRH